MTVEEKLKQIVDLWQNTAVGVEGASVLVDLVLELFPQGDKPDRLSEACDILGQTFHVGAEAYFMVWKNQSGCVCDDEDQEIPNTRINKDNILDVLGTLAKAHGQMTAEDLSIVQELFDSSNKKDELRLAFVHLRDRMKKVLAS